MERGGGSLSAALPTSVHSAPRGPRRPTIPPRSWPRDYLLPTGGTIYLPAGRYRITATISIFLDDATGYFDNLGINVRGDGSGSTYIINDSPSNAQPAFHLKGGSPGAGATLDVEWSGFSVWSAVAYKTVGFKVEYAAFALFRDIVTRNLLIHWQLVDALSATWIRCHARFGRIGVEGFMLATDGSTTNALTFVGCQFHMMYQHAINLNDATNFTMLGGSIVACGTDLGGGRVGDAVRCPVLLSPLGSAVGATFVGVYFETNAGIAAIRAIANGSRPGTLNVLGCSFWNNVPTEYVTNQV
ncbi:hypothetical protein P7L87_25630, partial [Vibrio parahaemolyticus]|nr:hypothetical protein [Vibrio parahaemolyticus]